MGRIKNIVWSTVLGAAVLSGACASAGQRSIAEVQTNPGKFHDQTVTVEGVVTVMAVGVMEDTAAVVPPTVTVAPATGRLLRSRISTSGATAVFC